ncbi:MAG TPA: hypothetical protein PK833_09030 [Vicingus sp.]|nr:hypothetical protein [Vicingus sp.]
MGDYNKNQTLIIDPLIYSTYIGGSNTEWGNSIVLNATNNAYITGQSESIDYDIIAGAFQTTNAGIEDVFVTKLMVLLYSILPILEVVVVKEVNLLLLMFLETPMLQVILDLLISILPQELFRQ